MANQEIVTSSLNSELTLTILCDNNAIDSSFLTEWGLSMALQFSDENLWLYDCGASDKFLTNAKKLNIDVSKAKGLALSHGHWDHTAGLDALMDNDFIAPVYAHPDFAAKRYAKEDNGSAKEASFPCAYPGTIVVRDHTELDDGMFMFTSIPRRSGFFEAVEGLYTDIELTKVDHVPDDAFLLLMTKSGPVVILGCCHSGLKNSLYHLRDITGISELHAIIGGLHLFNSDVDEYKATIDVIEEFKTNKVIAGHCTGSKAQAYLKDNLKCEFTPLGSGLRLKF